MTRKYIRPVFGLLTVAGLVMALAGLAVTSDRALGSLGLVVALPSFLVWLAIGRLQR